MALSIVDRPRSCRLQDSVANNATIVSDGYGTAILANPSVTINNGDRIFIKNTVTSYYGFWIATNYGPNNFRLQRYAGGSYATFTAEDASPVVLVCVATVDWSCVHLPIVYTLLSNLWPTNSSDVTRTVVGFHNDNGFVRLTLSGTITGVEVLDWLNVSSSSEDSLNGPFQILTVYSQSQFTINAPWTVASESAYTYLTATVQKYYNNYHAKIRIYAGLAPTHQWAALKPYELISELELTPDSANIIKLNVADIIKEKIEVLMNRPNYDSMGTQGGGAGIGAPYDLDRFCQFYISYTESYDDSNGTEVETFTGSYQSDFDFFQGWAADAKQEFKNRYSGFLAEHIYGTGPTYAKFLTEDLTPLIFKDQYFDLSVINTWGQSEVIIFQNTYTSSGALLPSSGDTTRVNASSEGILRVKVLVSDIDDNDNASYIEVHIEAPLGTRRTEVKRLDVSSACYSEFIYLTWKNHKGGFNYFLFTGNKDRNVVVNQTQEKDRNIFPDWPHSYGENQDSVTQETSRKSHNEIVVRSQNLTSDQMLYIAGIKSSALVQQFTSIFDRRTVIVDTSSFPKVIEPNRLYDIAFTIRYTDEIPSQSL